MARALEPRLFKFNPLAKAREERNAPIIKMSSIFFI
jgi:hypothetical protein